jgi:hypothetical protein
MIKANELRIGNWVKSNIEQQVTIETIEYLLNDKISDKSIIQPIPLTPEILEKCGFIYKETGSEVYEQERKIYGHLFIWGATSNDTYCHDFHCGGEIKYLHQLQNLYYAITGEELTYNAG